MNDSTCNVIPAIFLSFILEVNGVGMSKVVVKQHKVTPSFSAGVILSKGVL